jgi:formate dehydrogenase iron-sulfur subunit
MTTSFQPLDVIRVSATPDKADAEPNRDVEIVKLIDVSNCTGCKACQAACLDWNDKRPAIGENVGIFENPLDLGPDMFTVVRFAEWDNPKTGNFEWLIRKSGCMHCEDPGCLKACPAPGAIVQYANGIVNYIQDNCIGCGYCVKGCPFNVPRVSKTEQVAYKCTLCSDKVAMGQQPSCAKVCPTNAIVFGPKAQMLAYAETRIADLKSRGFEHAGLYNPQGVGGTHVMYVLHHADQPELYSGLPANPAIDPLVQAWKGTGKYVGMAAVGLAVVTGAIHHLVFGANRVSGEDEEEACKLVEEKRV